jgi:predicted phosphate transport protein (TIGR00153 family)
VFWRKNKVSFFDHFETLTTEMLSAGKLLHQLLADGVSGGDLARQIKNHEHAADQVVHAVNHQLSTTFIHPIDREDIIAFTTTLDDVVDGIHHSAEAFSHIFELSTTTLFARHFSEVILHECEKLSQVCPLLRHPSRHAPEIAKTCVEIHSLENEADELYREAMHTLFKQLQQQQILLPEYLAWSKIYTLLEKVTDKAEDAANTAETISVKYG